MATFRRLLLNSLLGGVVSSFLWFALTFWLYIETRSVVTTSVIGGAFGIFTALFGIVFGTFVDRHPKHTAMVWSASIAMACYVAAAVIYLSVPDRELLRLTGPWIWLLVAAVLAGTVAGNLRAIALSTCVTLLVPFEDRDRANGMVGTVTGIAFTVTSVFSGLAIGQLGMGWSIAITIGLTAASLAHLATISVDEPPPAPTADSHRTNVDLRGTGRIVRKVPGLMALVLFAAFNNLVFGVFMALMDPYGLSLVSVEAWGLLWGLVSVCFIGGGLFVARRGLGPRPLHRLMAVNLVNCVVCIVFPLQPSIWLLVAGMVVWMTLLPMTEAAEQTVLQRVVPFEEQGRVFGFAQTIENSAGPLVALAIGPVAQLTVMPFMTDGRGADAIGSWFGTGPDRGLALVFIAAGSIALVAALWARSSRWFATLARELASTPTETSPTPSASHVGQDLVRDQPEVVQVGQVEDL